MIINHNIPALSTYSQLTKNNKATASSLKKLSSGQQINTAADDASGLAISEKMRAQIRGLDQASVNAQDGISLVQSAEGNLGETEEILQRIRELAVKSANDTKVDSDREEIQKEVNQLTNEINRIGNTTEFNTQKLLNGGGTETKYDNTTLTVGAAAGALGGLNTSKTAVTEIRGSYTVSITGTVASGTVYQIGDESFTLSGGTATNTAVELLGQLQNNAKLSDQYDFAIGADSAITMKEKAGKAAGAGTPPKVGDGMTLAVVTASKKEVQGEYTFSLDKVFEKAGATISVAGAVIKGINSSDPGVGNFTIGGTLEEQAQSIAKAMNSNATINAKYDVLVDGRNITLREKAGIGVAGVATAPAQVTAIGANNTAARGKFTLETDTIVKAGGKFTIDGKDIAVVSDKNDKRLATGEAMLAADNLNDQATRLMNALNSNASLNSKYLATKTGSKVQLEQKAGAQSMNGPVTSSKTTATDGFQAKLQIGANAAQSMTVQINDMRANVLGVSGTKEGQTVKAADGKVAHYTMIKNVNNGTDDTSVEYALDLSDHEKATAAISVVNDAIEKVSAERSRLGAYQNRLDHTINNLGVSSQNMTDAESRIRDTDMAKEMMAFQKNQILGQAAQSMLAQANQLPQGVLQLLQ